MEWLLGLAGFAVLVWLLAKLLLQGPDLRIYDQPVIAPLRESAPNPKVKQLLAQFGAMMRDMSGEGSRFARAREAFDRFGADVDTDCTITPVDAGGVPAEWVLAPGGDPTHRLLYLHGGAFFVGSPLSHRRITTEFAKLINGAVLVIDYRLMPENKRLDSVADCCSAYRWILSHGPGGTAPLGQFFIAGDSAGGSLLLAAIAWARDAGLRQVDAAVALSPATDSTFASPSLKANIKTDLMLGPLLGPLSKIPRAVLLWASWAISRVRPNDPRVSPLLGDLTGLPPVLIQASTTEMLVDDCRRYVNKAKAAGSPVQLQLWEHMPHVWQLFGDELAESREAYDEVKKFLYAS